jgi:hypothetical protein
MSTIVAKCDTHDGLSMSCSETYDDQMKNGLVKYELSNNGMEAANCDPECHMLTI